MKNDSPSLPGFEHWYKSVADVQSSLSAEWLEFQFNTLSRETYVSRCVTGPIISNVPSWAQTDLNQTAEELTQAICSWAVKCPWHLEVDQNCGKLKGRTIRKNKVLFIEEWKVRKTQNFFFMQFFDIKFNLIFFVIEIF